MIEIKNPLIHFLFGPFIEKRFLRKMEANQN